MDDASAGSWIRFCAGRVDRWRASIADYQSGRVYDFDNRIRLFPGVAAQLIAQSH